MSGTVLPLLPIPRVLVPGTRASLPCARTDLRAGQQVAAALSHAGPAAPPTHAVGTLAHLEDIRSLGPGASLVRLAGRRLVWLSEARLGDGGWWAAVRDVVEPEAQAGELVTRVERALHRYQALRAEAGEDAGRPVQLSRDPVTASHEVASCLQISWLEVQEILEAGSAADRLARARAVLDREAELLRRLLGREGA